MPLTFDQIVVFVVLIFILFSLYKEWLGTSFTFLVGVIFLGVFNILTPKEILSGFANQHVAVIIMLLLLGDVLRKTGALEIVFDKIFNSAKSNRGFLGRMTTIVSFFSAFVNNTPIVAVMMPYIYNWCRRNNFNPSRFLIPLSYASILGGCATLIGTSTNLIVNGLVADQEIIPNFQEFQIFDFAWVGVPMIIIGTLYLIIFSPKLLPDTPDATTDYSSSPREYIVAAQVKKGSKLCGKSIKQAGLRSLKGLYLVEIIRDSQKFPAVSPDVILQAGDILNFAGDTDTVAELINSRMGLSVPEVGMLYKKRKRTEIVEIVISQNSTLINKTVKESNFRSKYDAAIISVYRNGERITGKLGNVLLKAGDVLLLYTGEDFYSRTLDSQEFYFISKVRDFVKVENYKIIIMMAGLFTAIMLSAFHVIPLFMGLIILLMASLIMNLTNPKELPKSIDYNLGLLIVLALALGVAMEKTGTAELIANSFIDLFKPFGTIGLLTGIYIITAVMAAYITNKAAVAIIFPISLTMSVNLGLPPTPFILVVAYAAAANFITPIGYQTNLMVYGPGKYSFNDFMKIGLPLTILYMIVTISVLSIIYFI